ncbi:MAG: PepSY-associated helix protein [Gemmatimonadetes bacterium]|nr:PepSY-associated helix protein [Gemmatimonadota bacterium]
MPFARVVSLARTLHIYLTMFAFVMMMFFAVTGVLLNHEDSFMAESQSTETRGVLPAALLAGPDKLMIVERLRAGFGAVGAVTTFDVDSAAMHVELKGPGRQTDAEIDRRTGAVVVTIERKGLVVRLDDLHRGKDGGRVWSAVIDLSAILLFLGSLSGILMWWALPRRRKLGLVALVGSIAIIGVIYMIAIP